MWQIWLIASGIFFVIEIFTVGFLIFWLGVAALIAMLISFITDSVILQTAVFVISSGLLIFATRPLTNKIAGKETIPTNVYSLIGKEVSLSKILIGKKALVKLKLMVNFGQSKPMNKLIYQKEQKLKSKISKVLRFL